MPFTVSHAAAALPLLRTPLIPSGLIVGTLAPDLLYLVPIQMPRSLSHSVLGLVTVDLLVGIVVVAAWTWLARPAVVDLSPRWLRERVADGAERRILRSLPSTALLMLLSLLVGGATHLVWDSFTHDGWPVASWPALSIHLASLPLYKWLQHGSSLVGLALLCAWTVRWTRRTPARPWPGVVTDRRRRLAWAVVVLAFCVAGLIAWIAGMAGMDPFDPRLVFVVAQVSIGTAVAASVAVIVTWLIRRGRDRRGAMVR